MKLFGASLFTLGLISSFIFAIVSAALIYIDQVNIFFAIGFTITINIVSWIISPAITDFFNKHFYKVNFIDESMFQASHPGLATLIMKVCTDNKFKFPKIGIISDKNPTAFTYGTARFNSRLVLTEGIFEYLNENEQKAVVAHEMGHIVHRDFVVMMIASTLIQILYQIYSVLIRFSGRGKGAGNIKLIAFASYALYLVCIYLLYYLSRVRETLADEYSAKLTSPQDLSNALIKIAYGIISAEDSDKAAKLLQGTRHMGIIDVKNAKNVGLISYITNSNPELIAEAIVFDRVSPWAKLIQLNSTHPLTGIRIDNLSKISKKIGKPFFYDIDKAIEKLNVNKTKLYGKFLFGIIVLASPVVLAGVLFFIFESLLIGAIGFSVGLLVKTIYSYPWGEAEETTILDQMRNVYASPIRGKAIRLQGDIIGKGIPGYVFSEDVMMRDSTGLTFLNYNSALSFIGNIFFALSKVKSLVGQRVEAEGWFFRGMGSSVSLRYLKTNDKKIRSHPMFWSIALSFLVLLVSFIGIFYFNFQEISPGQKNFIINGDSMNPIYMHNEEYSTNIYDENIDLIIRGEVVIYKFPKKLSEQRVGRVIGLPGDNLRILGGNVYINDQRLIEEYVGKAKTYGDLFIKEGKVIKVPQGSYVILGDNREYSMDSRYWGFLEKENITNIVGQCSSSCRSSEKPTNNFSLVNDGPIYEAKEIQYWSKEASNSTKVLSDLKTWVGAPEKDQTKIKRVIDLAAEENLIAIDINRKISLSQWLTEEDYLQMEKYEVLIKESNALLDELFGPEVKGVSTKRVKR